MTNELFAQPMQDRIWQQYFFYGAFRALAVNGIDGDYAEFGCWSGSSFWLAHQESRRHGHSARLWAFDSFKGLPPGEGAKDDHPSWVAGSMAMSLEDFHTGCARDGIPRSVYEVVPGYYHETLDRMGDGDAPTNIALAFIDCDMYSSTKSVLEFLVPRLKHGMIIALDDYYCWSATQLSGERRALLEVFQENSHWCLEPYLQFGWHGQSFVVEDRSLIPT